MGSWFNFLTLLYIGEKVHHCEFQLVLSSEVLHFCNLCCQINVVTGVILLFTVPVFYEKYDDKVDAFAEKAIAEMKKQYVVFDAKVLSKIPRGPLKDKKIA